MLFQSARAQHTQTLAELERLREHIGDLSRLAEQRRKEREGERVVTFYGNGPAAGMEPGDYYVRRRRDPEPEKVRPWRVWTETGEEAKACPGCGYIHPADAKRCCTEDCAVGLFGPTRDLPEGDDA